jgi:hypothetical protein
VSGARPGARPGKTRVANVQLIKIDKNIQLASALTLKPKKRNKVTRLKNKGCLWVIYAYKEIVRHDG